MKTIIYNRILSLLLTVTMLFCTIATQIQTFAVDIEDINSLSLPISGSSSGLGQRVITYKNFTADASKISDPHLKLSIYIARNDDTSADVSDLLKSSGIELTSSGKYDVAEIAWSNPTLNLEVGWNTIYLPFSEGKYTSGGSEFDISAINYFRIYHNPLNTSLEFTLKVQNVSIVAGGNLPISLPINSSTSGKGTPSIIVKGFNVDASKIVDPHLKISVYIARKDDPTADIDDLLGKRQIELTSSGEYDVAEINWDADDFSLDTGWNTLYLPISKATNYPTGDTSFDISNINYFRFYNKHDAGNVEFTLKVRDASIVSGSVAGGVTLPISGSKTSANTPQIEVKSFTADASNIIDPYLKISLYIAKKDDTSADVASLLGKRQIELTSSGKYDVAEINWDADDFTLDNGWNTLYLPFTTAQSKDDGTNKFDISNINYFRFYNKHPTDTITQFTIKVKNVSIISADEISKAYVPNDLVFASLNGTESNICHPGLTGEFNTASYDGKYFDRRLSFTPSGDIKDYAYVMRTSSGLGELDISEYNTFTFDLLVEDNGAWDDYKDKLTFHVMKSFNVYYKVSDKAFGEALENVEPGIKSKLTISLSSIGQKNLGSIAGFMIELKDGKSDKILHLKLDNAVVKYNPDYPTVIDDRIRTDMSLSDSVYFVDELGIKSTLGVSKTDTYQNISDTFVRNADIDDVVFNGDISETEFVSFKLYINEISALPSDLFVSFGYSNGAEIKYLNNIDIMSQITQSGWNTVNIQTKDIGSSEFLSDISAWKIFTNDTSALGENYGVILYVCNFAGIKLDTSPILTVGNNETEMYVTWFTTSDKLGSVVIRQGEDEVVIEAYEQGASIADFYYYNRAKITGLKANTEYAYKVGVQGEWSEEYTLSVKDFDGSFNFIHISDIQLNGTEPMLERWNTTLARINEYFPDTSFIVDTGDISDIYYLNNLYLSYKSPELLKNYITAVTPGNHDKSKNNAGSYFDEHFTIPESKETYAGYGANECDYWYSYNNVLFISLNANITDNDYHEAFVRKVVEEQGDKFDWKIVTTHFSAFSASYHSQEKETINYREQLAPVFSELKIDAVLSGHDHCYDRSYIMNGLTPNVSDGLYAANTEGGVLYISGTTASGSKYNSPVSGSEEYSAKIVKSQYGFVNCEVAAGRLIFTFYGSENMDILDKFTLYKDAEVSAADLVILRKGLLENSNEADLYDYNYDSQINIIDLVRLKKRLVNVA